MSSTSHAGSVLAYSKAPPVLSGHPLSGDPFPARCFSLSVVWERAVQSIATADRGCRSRMCWAIFTASLAPTVDPDFCDDPADDEEPLATAAANGDISVELLTVRVLTAASAGGAGGSDSSTANELMKHAAPASGRTALRIPWHSLLWCCTAVSPRRPGSLECTVVVRHRQGPRADRVLHTLAVPVTAQHLATNDVAQGASVLAAGTLTIRFRGREHRARSHHGDDRAAAANGDNDDDGGEAAIPENRLHVPDGLVADLRAEAAVAANLSRQHRAQHRRLCQVLRQLPGNSAGVNAPASPPAEAKTAPRIPAPGKQPSTQLRSGGSLARHYALQLASEVHRASYASVLTAARPPPRE